MNGNRPPPRGQYNPFPTIRLATPTMYAATPQNRADTTKRLAQLPMFFLHMLVSLSYPPWASPQKNILHRLRCGILPLTTTYIENLNHELISDLIGMGGLVINVVTRVHFWSGRSGYGIGGYQWGTAAESIWYSELHQTLGHFF